MGYGTSTNKKQFMSKIKLLGGSDAMQYSTKVYKDLSLLGLGRDQLRQLLVMTCKNGWEYFTREILDKLGNAKRFTCRM